MNRKRGSVTVFIMIFFVTLVSMISIFIDVSKDTAVKSSTNVLGRLWGNSILAEYDINLQKRYNIFGFYGMPDNVAKKINFYANESFRRKKYIKYDGCSCALYDYSLVNTKIFKKQIMEVGKLSTAESFIKPDKVKRESSDAREATIRNEAVLSMLPSKGSKKSISISGIKELIRNGTSMKKVMNNVTDTFFENKYLFTYYRNRLDSNDLGKTFFHNEIEYIICGKQSDEKNAKSVRNKIVLLREPFNLAYLRKDPKKYGEAMAAAELITPGPAAVATQKGILSAWALAESINDYKLLVNGHKVSFAKTEKTWAIDLDSVIANRNEDCIFTGIDEGEDYEDYLKIFTYVLDENVKLLRMMDLIQINMKYLYYNDFLLKDYNGGLNFKMNVNGNTYEFRKEY